jgi:hypothetical protein
MGISFIIFYLKGEFMDDPYEINKSILKDPLQLPEMAHETIP